LVEVVGETDCVPLIATGPTLLRSADTALVVDQVRMTVPPGVGDGFGDAEMVAVGGAGGVGGVGGVGVTGSVLMLVFSLDSFQLRCLFLPILVLLRILPIN
jgi:hypothetical protein